MPAPPLVVCAKLYQFLRAGHAKAVSLCRQFLNRFDGFFASREHRWNRQLMANHLVGRRPVVSLPGLLEGTTIETVVQNING